jgi:tripartite-type tricarboxylate transporter receptor subunit TctC
MEESGIAGFAATLLTGVVAPAHTPGAIVSRVNGAINAALRTDEVKAVLTKFGSTPRISSPEEFAAFLSAQTQVWSNVAKAAHVQID